MNYRKSITFILVDGYGIWCHDYTVYNSKWFIDIDQATFNDRYKVYDNLSIKDNKK